MQPLLAQTHTRTRMLKGAAARGGNSLVGKSKDQSQLDLAISNKDITYCVFVHLCVSHLDLISDDERENVHVSSITLYVFVLPYTRMSSSAVFPAQTHINPSEHHTFHSLALTAMQWPSLCDAVISFQRHCREPGGENVSHTLCVSLCTWHCNFFLSHRIITTSKTHNRLQHLRNICEYFQFACT